MSVNNRREVSARRVGFFQTLAKKLVDWKLTPNQISVLSAVFATGAFFAFYSYSQSAEQPCILLLLLGIFGIQLRLVCNLIDGLMAVEGGLKTASGEVFNDFPDRISDVVILVGAGYVAQLYLPQMLTLSWFAGVLAVMTAYVRCLGAAMTGVHDFSGPMAKQHRMFVITLGALGTIAESYDLLPMGLSMSLALIGMSLGTLLTVINRLMRLYRKLENI